MEWSTQYYTNNRATDRFAADRREVKQFVNPKYERKEDEDLYEYGLRLIEIKMEQKPDDLDWEDIVEAAQLDCHRDSLRKAASVTPYSGYAVAQHFKRKYAAADRPDKEKYLGELDIKIAEARKEAKRFFDQRREFNKLVDRIGRAENLEDRLVEAAERLSDTVGKIEYGKVPVIDPDNEAVLVLSDWHYGMTTDNIWNRYNTEICKERVRHIADNAVKRVVSHQCSKLHIVVLGDLIHGCTHVSARVASEELVCDQIMESAEILAQMIEYLSGSVEQTYVYMTYGNHARSVQSKKDSIHADNMERIIPWWLKQRLGTHENIFIINDFENEFLLFDVLGYGFCASHGDLDSVKKSPTLLSTLLHKKCGHNVDYILLGDKHHRESFEQLGITAMICGALCGADDYANDRRLYSDPEQTMLIVSREDGVDAEYHLRCK